MTTVCRLCLKPAIDNVSFHYTDNSGFSTTSLVKALVPELYLGLSPNPVVCKSCYFHLRQAYVFRLRCLRSENLIGIYIRETKNTESLVLLDDVVNFWKKRYENKSEGLQCNLEEWFGKGRDKAEAPIILNQIASIVGSGNGNINKDVSAEDKQQEDDTFDLKEISKESKETNSEKEKTAECIGDCSKPKDGISCKFTEFTGEREKRHDKKDYNNDIIVIDDIAKEFDDFINKACMESPEETIKIVMEPDCQTPKVKFNTSPKLVKILTKIKRPKSDKAPDVIESPKDKSKTIKIVVDEESHSSNEQYTAVLKLASKIPTKQCNTTTPMKKNVIEPGEDTDRSINLICDMNDMDINSIVNELRKDENLEKLGFSNSEDDESYFIDKVDNKLSFALLPKHPDNDARKETDIDGGEKTTSLINRNKMDMSNRPPQKKVRNDSVSMGFSGNGKQSEFINDVTGAKEPVKGTSIGGCLDTRLNEGQKDEDKRKKALNENVTEVNLNRKSLERLPILLNDRIESEKDMFPPESEKPPLHPEPVSSTSQDKSPAIPMPIIRVRPASALQKVRTLNHELWPQNEMNNHAEDSFQLLYPMSSPQVPHGLPAKMGDGDTRPSPIVLNSQLDLSGGMASTLKPPPPPKPPSKLKEKRPVLKTYQRKIADGSKVLRRVNPLTYKALEEMQKMGLIKVVGVAEESQINKPIQQSLSYMVKRGVNLVNLDNFLENSGFELENPEGDLGNSGDLRVNSGEHSWDSGDLRGNSEDRRGNSGDLRENSGERSWDSGDLRGNSGDLRENSEERSWDSGGRRGNSGDIRGSSGDLRENSGDLRANSGDLGGISGASLGNVMDRRGSRDERNEYAIDIKEEPLNCTESDVLMNFGEVDQAAESEGETTRSASETSFMDTLHSQNDLVKTIVENIPDMGEEQYDEPEYVHINNVSFSDLTKMMGESKKHREIVNSKQMQPPQMNKKMTASERRKCYKYCFVPGCKVNSKRNKEKTFFKVPKREEVQKIWLAAVGRKFLRFKSPIYFCEDHFDEEDISLRSSNLKQFGSLPIKQLKIGALPHTCLTKRKPGIVNTDQISKLKQLQSEVKTTETSHKPKAIIIEKHRPDDTIIEEPCTSIAESKLRKANEEEYDFKKTPQPYKYDRRSCFVPGCSTNSRQHPNKIYVLVPTEESEQKVWFKTFKRPFYCNPFRNIKYYCCEDHFTIIPGWESVVRDHKFGGLVPRSCVQLTIALKNEEEYDPKKTPQSHKYGLRSCFVPGCSTNSRQHPNKIYALVPRKESEQKVWFETFKRPFSYYQNIKYYCCEDHFTIIPGMESVARDNKFGGLVPRSCVQLKIALKPNQPEHTPSSTKEVQKRSIGWWCKYLRVSDNVKSCVVPNCNNSMKECPDKVFIRIPAVDKVQKRWYAALGRDCNQPVKDEPDLCCEDHFSPKQLDMFKSFGPCMLLREFFLPRKITTKKPPKPIKGKTKYSKLTHKRVVL